MTGVCNVLQLILICIGLLEALDRLQERLHLPSSLVKDLKRKLSKMVDRSLARPLSSPTCAKLKQYEVVGDAIAESDMWDAAKPEEVKGLVHWLFAGMNQTATHHSLRYAKPDLSLPTLCVMDTCL